MIEITHNHFQGRALITRSFDLNRIFFYSKDDISRKEFILYSHRYMVIYFTTSRYSLNRNIAKYTSPLLVSHLKSKRQSFLAHGVMTLQWRHNERDGVSDHQRHKCLPNGLCADKQHQSPASPAFVRGIHRWPVNFPHKGSVTRKTFPCDDIIMNGFCMGLAGKLRDTAISSI